MKNRTFFLVISTIVILILAACDTSSLPQPAISTPTPEPTSVQPTPQSTPPQSSTRQLFISLSSTSTQGSASVSVHTLPGAAITIEVTHCGHSSKETQYANTAGDYTWTWTPDKKCGGMATARVMASLNGQSATSITSFSV